MCKQKLSDRIRAGSEAAPWVIEAVIELETEREELYRRFCLLEKQFFDGGVRRSAVLSASPYEPVKMKGIK